mgnify:CR=1 FL=1
MNILIALFSIFSFNMEPMELTLKGNNIFITDKYPIIIETINCQEVADKSLAFITYNENDPYTIKQIQFSNGNICQINSIKEKLWFQS